MPRIFSHLLGTCSSNMSGSNYNPTSQYPRREKKTFHESWNRTLVLLLSKQRAPTTRPWLFGQNPSVLYYKITTSFLRRRTGLCWYLWMHSTGTNIALDDGVKTTSSSMERFMRQVYNAAHRYDQPLVWSTTNDSTGGNLISLKRTNFF